MEVEVTLAELLLEHVLEHVLWPQLPREGSGDISAPDREVAWEWRYCLG